MALKFLAAHLVSDQEIRKRFEREAKAAAALNHPNICTVHEIDEVEGKTFIAMAFIEGDGLDKRIEAGPLKLKDALDSAIQTAHGLEAAHGKGIVHRDIKPPNLMITGSGSKQLVTIMDFGLALLTDRSKLTRMDETMGTVAYMSPEQTYGMELDHRTDIWSLGVVIYEMVTGQQPFKGHYDKAVMYSITNEQPEPITARRTAVPMELEWLVNKALAKQRDERYQSTADMVVDLEALKKKIESGKSTILRTAAAGSVGARHAVPAAPQEAAGTRAQHAVPLHSAGDASEHLLANYRVIENLEERDDALTYRAEDTKLQRSVTIRILSESEAKKAEKRQQRRQRITLGLAAGMALSLLFAGLVWFRGASTDVVEYPLRRFTFSPPNLAEYQTRLVAISPNGKHMVYVTGERDDATLWVRDLDRQSPRQLERTEGADDPFWSPDSQFIAFATDQGLKRVPVQGGDPITLCPLPGTVFGGGSWSPDGNRIVFSSGPPFVLHEVSSRGGSSKVLLGPEDEQDRRSYYGPHFLPAAGGQTGLLYVTGGSQSGVGLLILETGERRALSPGFRPVYAPSGHIIFQPRFDETSLRALPFDLETLSPTGEAFPIAEDAAVPSVSLDGTLVYTDAVAGGLKQFVWLDRQGAKIEAVGQPQEGLHQPTLSPDGLRVAAEGQSGNNRDIWVHDLARGVRTRLTFDPARQLHAAWSPAGREIAFASFGDHRGISVKRADGSGEAELIVETQNRAGHPVWSPDGRFLMYDDTSGDIWFIPTNAKSGKNEPTPFVQSPSEERVTVFSPDGRYVAYCSDESGRWEAYMRPFPEGEARWQVSSRRGTQPRWARNGKELFYGENSVLMAVPISAEEGFSPGTPVPLFDYPSLASISHTRGTTCPRTERSFCSSKASAVSKPAPFTSSKTGSPSPKTAKPSRDRKGAVRDEPAPTQLCHRDPLSAQATCGVSLQACREPIPRFSGQQTTEHSLLTAHLSLEESRLAKPEPWAT